MGTDAAEIEVQCRVQRPYETPWCAAGTWRARALEYGALLARVCAVLGVRAAPATLCLHECARQRAVASGADLAQLLDDAAHDRAPLVLRFALARRWEALCPAPLSKRDTVHALRTAVARLAVAARTDPALGCDWGSGFRGSSSGGAAGEADVAAGPAVAVVYAADNVALYPYRELLSYPGACGPHDTAHFAFIRYAAALTSDLRDTHATVYWPGACALTTCALDDLCAVDWSVLTDSGSSNSNSGGSSGADAETKDKDKDREKGNEEEESNHDEEEEKEEKEDDDDDDRDNVAIARLVAAMAERDGREGVRAVRPLCRVTADDVARLTAVLQAQSARALWCALRALSRRTGLPAVGRTLPRTYASDPAYALPPDFFPPFCVVPDAVSGGVGDGGTHSGNASSDESDSDSENQQRLQQRQQQSLAQRQQRLCGLANALAALTQKQPPATTTTTETGEATETEEGAIEASEGTAGAAAELPEEWCAANAAVFGARTLCGLTLLHCAALRDSAAWLALFARWGRAAGAHIDDRGGCCALTPLAVAAQRGNLAAVRACCAAGADPDVRTGARGQKDEGATALFFAAREGRAAVCAHLVCTAHADVNAALADGSTPLAAARDPAVAELLLAHGARVAGLVTPAGNMLWAGSDCAHAAALLRLYLAHGGAQCVNARAGYMAATPLARICGTCTVRDDQALACARLLVAHGADPAAPDKDGRTPLQTLLATAWPAGPGDRTAAFVALLLEAAEAYPRNSSSGNTGGSSSGSGGNTGSGGGPRRPPWWPLTPHAVVAQCGARQDWASLEVFARHGLPLTRALRRTVAGLAARTRGAAERVFAAAAQWERDEREREAQALRGIDALLADMGETPRERPRGKGAARRRRAQRKAAAVEEEEEEEEHEERGKEEEEKRKKEEAKDEKKDLRETEVPGLVAAAAVVVDSDEDQTGWVKANQRPRALPVSSASTEKKEQAPKKKKQGKKKKAEATKQEPQKQQRQQVQQPQKQPQEQERRPQQNTPVVKKEEKPPQCVQPTALEKRCADLEAQLEKSRAREHELEQRIAELEQRLAEHEKIKQEPQPQPQPQSWGMLSMTQWLDEHAGPAASAPFQQLGPARLYPAPVSPSPPRPARPQPSAAAKAVASAFDTLFADDSDGDYDFRAHRGRRAPLH